MAENFSELDEMMGMNALNVDIFAKPSESTGNPNIYRTSPAKTVADDGHYHCKVRLLYNPFNRARTIVHSVTYNLHDDNGWFTVKSLLGENAPNAAYYKDYKNCPIFKAWKKVRYNEDEEVQERARLWHNKNKQEADYILVQVIEDKNQPDRVGKFLAWKLPATVRNKVEAKRNPSKDSGKAPMDILNYITGRILDIEVVPGQGSPTDKDGRYYRETKYDLCEFDSEVYPITKIDGTPLFNDDELELIEKYDKKVTAIAKMKSPEEQASAYELLKANKLYTDFSVLMKRAIEYIKENAIDIVEELAYQPWDAETASRVEATMNSYVASLGKDTSSASTSDSNNKEAANAFAGVETRTPTPSAPDPIADVEEGDDLPF